MTLQRLIEIYNKYQDFDLVIKEIANKREAEAFRKHELKEAYRHVGDIITIFEHIEKVTKEFNLKPMDIPQFNDLHIYFKVGE